MSSIYPKSPKSSRFPSSSESMAPEQSSQSSRPSQPPRPSQPSTDSTPLSASQLAPEAASQSSLQSSSQSSSQSSLKASSRPPSEPPFQSAPQAPPHPTPQSSLTSGHRKRLRDRFLHDPSAMPDYEVLELLLGYVFARKDTKPLAKMLLKRFGSIRGVLDAKAASLQTVDGIGPSTETFFTLLREIFARYEEAPLYEHDFISSPKSIARIARIRLGRSAHEELWGAYLDASNRVIAWKQISVGTYNAAAVSAKDIIALALSIKASAFILVHNHPGGTLSPSKADILLTERVATAAQVLHLRFLDHVIITAEASYSIVREMEI